MSNTVKPIVIIGTGLAGYNLAKEIRKIDQHTPLVLISIDDAHFYSKPQLSTAMAQAKSAQHLVITDVATMRNQLQATIYDFTKVVSIDTTAKSLIIEHQLGLDELYFSKLVFAVGASPKPFPLLKNIQQNYRVNSLQEYAAFREVFQQAEHITIIGSGLVGCEFAFDFANRDKKITVVTPDPHPLYNLVPANIGQALQSELAKQGIDWHIQSHIENVDDTSNIALQLSTSKVIQTNTILTAIGLHPNIALAKSASIATKQGIVVDEYLQTSHENIFALGDCAEIDGICRQYVAPILQSARALAQTLCGKPTAVIFPSLPITLKVSRYPIITFAPKQMHGEWTFECYPDGIKALFHDINGVLQGYALSGSQIEHRQQCLKLITQSAQIIA
jgi:rubredoxin-NAD+ reductase